MTIRRVLVSGLAIILSLPVALAVRAQGAPAADGDQATATFAGGCFWCVEEAFDAVDGVVETTSGFTGGTVPNPSYERVSAGGTGHIEAVRVRYDPDEVSYADLLDVFWHNVDPLDAGGQFCDRGDQYRSAIFVASEEQRRLAEASKQAVADLLDEAVATTIEPAQPFFPAEAYHQDYYEKNPLVYKFYKWRCGRAERLEAVWGADPADVATAIAG